MYMNSTKLKAFAEQLEKLAADLDMPTLVAILGGLGGSYAAYKGTHDPRAKMRNALLASVPSAGLSYLLGKKLFPATPSLEQSIATMTRGAEGVNKQIADASSILDQAGKIQIPRIGP